MFELFLSNLDYVCSALCAASMFYKKLYLFIYFFRETFCNQDTVGDINLQKSTGAFFTDKDRELETLRNEVLSPTPCLNLSSVTFDLLHPV